MIDTFAGMKRNFQPIRCVVLALITIAMMCRSPAAADVPTIEHVAASCTPKRICSFDVTVKHADTGWDHYANRWEIQSESGKILATRILHHPHVDEQPFTRSLENVQLPNNITEVYVVAFDTNAEKSNPPYRVRIGE